ncbi:hypothetical protein JZ751_014837 [Albula glossodonta]|uniref:Golgi integral membrane protein 4 n=1 Tax=Albula glossodonta TaxID=121402 RepID=A0A8T2N4I1_9TELE|nr:hypothetical protein JZ751_014837 [Albula glossodonta]
MLLSSFTIYSDSVTSSCFIRCNQDTSQHPGTVHCSCTPCSHPPDCPCLSLLHSSPPVVAMLGLCWRRQKCSGVTALFVMAACAACAVVLLLLSRLHESTEELHTQSQRCRQQQEALSAQLQVVYEHRSRLERSLQKERIEHKKTKEDFLVYKLEAQEALNKEKQDAMNRYSALSSQNNILKNQLADLRSQLLSQQTANGEQQLTQRKALEECQHKGALQHTESQDHIAALQDTVMKLREESRLLRKAHQDVHAQLLSAQAQVEEFRQFRQDLQKMPGSKVLSVIPPQIGVGKHKGSELLELKVTFRPLTQLKQKTQQDTLSDGLVGLRSANQKDPLEITIDNRPGEEVQEQQRQDKNFLLTNQKPSSNHWRDLATNEVKNTEPEELNEDKDFVEALDNGDLDIDTLGEEIPQGQGIIAQEPMEDGRIGDTEDQLEEEEEEEEEGGNEEEY